MDAISIGRKKQLPDAVEICKKKMPSQKHSRARKVKMVLSKQQEVLQNTEPHVPRTVKFNKLLVETHSYTPLSAKSTMSEPANNSANIIPIHEDKRLCSVRAGIATFVIIIVLIAAAGTSVGIVFAAINSQNFSGTGTTNNNNNSGNQNSFSTISPILLTSSISIGNQVGLPCSGYTLINDPTRSYAHIGSSSPCDNGGIFNTSNGGAWIRFGGSNVTGLPLSSPGVNHCGAFISGWYNDTLPTTMNVITNGTVCFETAAGECEYFIDISVVYCPSNFYVYFLPPVTVCNARYCTD